MLQGIDEHLIVEHAFVISFFLLLDLAHEEFLLYERVVEFGVGVAKLVVLDEEFEPLSKSGLGPVVLGQRRHHLRMLDDEGRVETLGLEKSAHQLVDQPYRSSGIRAFHFVLLALSIEERLSFFRL